MSIGISGILGAITAAPELIKAIDGIVEKFVPDPAQKAQAALDLQKLVSDREVALATAMADVQKAQIGVNAIEAQSESRWKSGWRPAVGWTCVAGCLYGFVIQPLLAWATGILGVAIGAAIPMPPAIDLVQLLGLLFSLLGLGAYRTVEKVQGKA